MENGSQRMLVKVSWIWETKGILPKNENLMNILIVLLGSMLFIARVRFDVSQLLNQFLVCVLNQKHMKIHVIHFFTWIIFLTVASPT